MAGTEQAPTSGKARRGRVPSGTSSDTTESLLVRARQLAPLIREHSDIAERDRRLPKPVLDALGAAGFQSLFTPRAFGGLEVDPVTCARIVEEIASADSAAGWALQSANVNAWWASRLVDAAAEEIYGTNPGAMMAATFHPPQHATEVAGGYRVTGRAPFASIIHDCEWVLISAFIMEGGAPRMTEFGPAFIALIMPRSDVEILDTWYTLGMRGTDSNDIAVDNVFVPAHRTYVLSPEFKAGRHFQGALYRFPAAPIVGLFGAAVLLATARTALTEFRELAVRKTPFGSMKTLRDRGTVQASLAGAEGTLRSARAFFYETLSAAWVRTEAGEPATLEERGDLLLACIHAAKGAAEVTEIVHRLAGTTGIYVRSRLERCFRDAHTLRHHGFVSESKLETVGQIYLGLPPDFPLIVF